ncbi:Phosphatidyl-N-methylethanolamine N-methyltransferase [Diplonema papillatum]|nr:Phosphatidyl-N-methylethanolamine N-methyltransferase [Diplonema papillatum]
MSLVDTLCRAYKLVDPSNPEFIKAVVGIAACPTVWNSLAQLEYNTQALTNLFLGHRYVAAYALAAWIFGSSGYRDILFNNACDACPSVRTSDNAELLKTVGYGLIGAGQVFVLTAFARLGVTGTFLGDYFGILMKERVTGFPFNVLENPMYDGATLSFLGLAVRKGSPAGVVLSLWVWLVYRVSTLFYEGPFTAKIYAEKAEKDRLAKAQ